MHILVTGGLGYIGSHTCVELLQAGHGVTILDNLSNSRADVAERIAGLGGAAPIFIEGDVRDRQLLCRIFREQAVDAVIHFAGLKAVGESVAQPLRYYECNVGGSLVLFEEMAEAGVKTLVFSSSATVYGDPHAVPIREDFPLRATNPYGRSKLMLEEVLADMAAADSKWRIARLRYFNPVGAHESGLLGEAPNGPMWPRLLPACVPACPSSATTIPPLTVPGCGISFMWWTWPRGIWQPWQPWRVGKGC